MAQSPSGDDPTATAPYVDDGAESQWTEVVFLAGADNA